MTKNRKKELALMLDKEYDQLKKNHPEFFKKVEGKRVGDLSMDEILYLVQVIFPDIAENVARKKESK